MDIIKWVLSLFGNKKKEVNVSKTMSTYEKNINRMKKRIHSYQGQCNMQKANLIKTNEFINKLRDEGRITKDEIETFFKK